MATTALSLCGYLMIDCSWTSVYLVTAELFPTVLRYVYLIYFLLLLLLLPPPFSFIYWEGIASRWILYPCPHSNVIVNNLALQFLFYQEYSSRNRIYDCSDWRNLSSICGFDG